MKETMVFYFEWDDYCEELSDTEYRKMMKAVINYARTRKNTEFEDRMMRSIYKVICRTIDRADTAYQKRCETNRENGKKGGAPKGNQNARKQPKTTESNETSLPEPDPDPHPNVYITRKWARKPNRFKNFDEREYSEDDFQILERAMN